MDLYGPPPCHARGRPWAFRIFRKNHDDFLRKNHVLPEEILYGTTMFFRKIRKNKFFFFTEQHCKYFTEEHSPSVIYGRTMFFRKIRKDYVLPENICLQSLQITANYFKSLQPFRCDQSNHCNSCATETELIHAPFIVCLLNL